MVVVKYVIASMEDSLAYSYRTKIVLSYDLEFAFLTVYPAVLKILFKICM